jgi:hypothetical protein
MNSFLDYVILRDTFQIESISLISLGLWNSFVTKEQNFKIRKESDFSLFVSRGDRRVMMEYTGDMEHQVNMKSTPHSPNRNKKGAKVGKSRSSQRSTSRSSASHPSGATMEHRQTQHHHGLGSFSTIVPETMDPVHNRKLFDRRSSSFASPSSPWARRRSFLSSSMIKDEKHMVYELHRGRVYSDTPVYSISLRESQGFTWNQDLFASQYQQQSAIVYDDDDDDEDAIMFDAEDDDEDYASYSFKRRSVRTYSYSVSNEFSGINKVKVLDFAVHTDDEKD